MDDRRLMKRRVEDIKEGTCAFHFDCEDKLMDLSKRTNRLTWAVAMGTAFFMAAGLILSLVVSQVNTVKADAIEGQAKHEIIVQTQQDKMDTKLEGVEDELKDLGREVSGLKVYIQSNGEDIKEIKEILNRVYSKES